MLTAYYINLEDQPERRRLIEENFRLHGRGVELKRVPAFDVDHVRRSGIEGRITDPEKACFLSHRQAIETSLADSSHALILEDDAQISPRSIEILNRLIAHAGASLDLLFAEACVVSIYDMFNFFGFRRHLKRHDRVELVELKGMNFGGAVGYVVMNHAKKGLLERLNAPAPLDVPYDIWLAQTVSDGRMRASLSLPFLVSMSAESDVTSIQFERDPTMIQCWGAFRRLMFIDFDESAEDPTLALRRTAADFPDRNAEYFSDILKVMLAERLDISDS